MRRAVARAVMGTLVIAITGAAGWTTSSATARETPAVDASRSPQEATSPAVPRVLRDLDLTEEQADAVRGELEARQDSGGPEALWEAAAGIREVLDPEQLAALEARLAERPLAPRAERRRPGEPRTRFRSPDGLGGPRLEGVEGLDLSDEQRARLRGIREEYGPRIREIWGELRAGSLSREEAEARSESIRESIHAEVLDVLSPEQRALLEEHEAAAEARRQEAEARRQARWDSASARLRARMEGERQAMIDVLDLSSAQIAALDSLRDDAWGAGAGPPGSPRWETDRPSLEELAAARAERHEAIVRILDDAQRETWVVHAALMRTEMQRRAGRGLREPARRRTSRSGR